MNNFLFCPATCRESGTKVQFYGLEHSFSHEGNLLCYDGRGVEFFDGTGIYINGYVLPRNSIFSLYGGDDPYRLIASLYGKYGSEFTRYIKGYFSIFIFCSGHTEIFFDHTGLFRAFYVVKEQRLWISGSVMLLKKVGINLEFDEVSLSMQSLFHRVPLNYTVFRDILKTTYGDSFIIRKEGAEIKKYWNPEDLLVPTAGNPPGVSEIADLFRENIKNFNLYLKPDHSYITLTGGKDCRTILAALLSTGVKPAGLTYGNEMSRDATFARKLADSCGLKHSVVSPPGNKEWFEEEAGKVISAFNLEINIHRSHRLYAFSEAAESSSGKTAFYTGYLGGELLTGVYYDDLIFTKFQTDAWESGKIRGVEERLASYFHIPGRVTTEAISERMSGMKNLDNRYSRLMKSFFGIFEIGIPHHSQDVSLSSRYWRYPYPAFLDIEFLEVLFKSRYSFLTADDRSVNLFKRYEHYILNMQIQHQLCPDLDNIPFGKRGSFSTREYLQGLGSWILTKGYRYIADRSHYPPSFVYGDGYREFIDESLTEIMGSGAPVSKFYETGRALSGLSQEVRLKSESAWHRYSNIVMFHILEQRLNNEVQDSDIQK